MRVTWWHVPRGFCVAVVLVAVLFAGTSSLAAEAEAEDYDAEDCLSRGRACLEEAEYEEALKWFERGLALEPEDVFLHLRKAEALYGLERLEEAVACIDRAIERIQLVKGFVLAKLGRYEEAVEIFDRVIKLSDDESGYQLCLAYEGKIHALKEMGRLGEVVETYDEALASNPDESSIHYEKGEILVELGRLEEAVESFDRVIKLSDDESGYQLCLAYEGKIHALKEMGRLGEVVETYDEALTRFPEDTDLGRGFGPGGPADGLGLGGGGALTGLAGPAEKAGTTATKKARVKAGTPGITGTAAADSLRSSAVIARIVNQRKAGIEYIYKKYLKTNPTMEGKLVVRFTIAASGDVTAASKVSSTMGNPAMEQEVCTRIMTWKFPPIDAGDVTVVYPFVFYSAAAGE